MTAIGCLQSAALAILWLFLAPLVIAQSSSSNPDLGTADSGAPIDDQRLDQALATYEADDRLQRARPLTKGELPIELQTRQPPHPFLQAIANFFRAIGGFLGYVLMGLILLAILVGFYLVFGEHLALRRRQKPKSDGPDLSVQANLQPRPGQARALLEDADALAAAGRFDEAVHLLLFRSINDIQERTPGTIRQSYTAREIGALGILPTQVRTKLYPIIQIVERSFFGGRSVTEESWAEARTAYQDFAFGKAWI